MCIYCTTTNYRKIYESHNGLIPKDSDGRTYEIHHIDGNHSNNEPSNLEAVTLQEHYDIHYAQGDWYACTLMKLQRMDYTSEEISILTSKQNKKRIDEGTHHFLGGEIQSKFQAKMVEAGTHTFLGKNNPSHKRVEAGTHNLLGDIMNRKRVDAGTHNFLGKNNPSHKRVEAGTHNLLRKNNPNNPSKIKCSCIWCKKETSMPVLIRSHSEEKCTNKSKKQ